MSSVYSGLSWIGETEAKISFYGVLIFSIIFVLIIIVNIISNSFVIFSAKTTEKQKTETKQKIANLLKLLLILSIIFGVILGFLYWNMEVTEHNKTYATFEGVMDLASDMNRF